MFFYKNIYILFYHYQLFQFFKKIANFLHPPPCGCLSKFKNNGNKDVQKFKNHVFLFKYNKNIKHFKGWYIFIIYLNK